MKSFIISLSIAVCCISCGKQHKIEFPADREWGVVNINGDTIIPFCYDEIEAFSSSLFIAYRDTVCVLVDTLGQILTPLKYSKIKPQFVKFFPPDSVSTAKRDSIILVNGTNYSPPDKLISFANKKSGIINTNGKEIIPCIYDGIQSWNEIYIVRNNEKFGLIDSIGKEITPIVYDVLNPLFVNFDLFIAKRDGSYGLLDTAGKVRLPFDLQHIELDYNLSRLIVENKDGSYGIINPFETEMVQSEYNEKDALISQSNEDDDEPKYYISDGINHYTATLPLPSANEKIGIIDDKEKITVPPIYDFLRRFYFFSDSKLGVYEAWIDKKAGLIDNKGIIILPLDFEDISYTYDDNAVMLKKDGKWGIINYKDKSIIVPFEYDDINLMDYMRGLMSVRKGDKRGIINKEGQIIFPFTYSQVNMHPYDLQLFIVKK